ncbi:MAG: ATP-binding protein, partial [Pseudomonadota bacterium]
RMPAPKLSDVDLSQLLRESIFSRKCLGKSIEYSTKIDEDSHFLINCDARQISQVLLNLFKNAEESIEHSNNSESGKIFVTLSRKNNHAELDIIDNGCGFPDELFDRLTEPYITSKSTGTGLGLAIVKKILDDHNIDISFANNSNNGAIIKLIFNLIE